MPSERPVHVDHDAGSTPVARAFHPRLERLDSGALALVSDIEVFDEERYRQFRGFSIAFHRTRQTKGAPPTVELSFNPRQIPPQEIEKVLAAVPGPRGEEVASIERVEKSAVEIAVLVFVFVSRGFWDEAGADLYRWTKAFVQRLRTEERAPQVGLVIRAVAGKPEIRVRFIDGIEGTPLGPISAAEITRLAREVLDGEEPSGIVAQVDAGGTIQLASVTSTTGRTIRPAASSHDG
jgi:hypothetical protein